MPDTLQAPSRTSSGIADWLIRERLACGFKTQMELARAAGVTQATISNIELGKSRNPHPKTWDGIVKALRVERTRSTKPTQNSGQSDTTSFDSEANDVALAAKEQSRIEGIGELVDFEPHDDDALPEDPGVYIFYDVTERPTYIGQSDNIRRRIRGKHDEKFWYREPIVQTAAYIRVDDRDERLRIEKLLITVLRSHALINKAHVQRGVGDDDA